MSGLVWHDIVGTELAVDFELLVCSHFFYDFCAFIRTVSSKLPVLIDEIIRNANQWITESVLVSRVQIEEVLAETA